MSAALTLAKDAAIVVSTPSPRLLLPGGGRLGTVPTNIQDEKLFRFWEGEVKKSYPLKWGPN